MRASFRSRVLNAAPLLALAAMLVASAPAAAPTSRRTYIAFAKQNESAMNTMMTGMAVKPTGDVDMDFVSMMIPHHRGGIDMARAVLRYGHNRKLAVIARGIVAQQTREIVMMREAVGGREPVPASGDSRKMMMH